MKNTSIHHIVFTVTAAIRPINSNQNEKPMSLVATRNTWILTPLKKETLKSSIEGSLLVVVKRRNQSMKCFMKKRKRPLSAQALKIAQRRRALSICLVMIKKMV